MPPIGFFIAGLFRNTVFLFLPVVLLLGRNQIEAFGIVE
jgi:hypothetical protein